MFEDITTPVYHVCITRRYRDTIIDEVANLQYFTLDGLFNSIGENAHWFMPNGGFSLYTVRDTQEPMYLTHKTHMRGATHLNYEFAQSRTFYKVECVIGKIAVMDERPFALYRDTARPDNLTLLLYLNRLSKILGKKQRPLTRCEKNLLYG